MCGIAVCWSLNESTRSMFSANADSLLAHRGPDDHEVWQKPPVALVHTRLSILELSAAGHQPMISASGRFTLVYNGEVYNHLDLRRRFLPAHSFRGHSDSETIIELFEVMGERMLQHLVGMWAMAVWDSRTQQLFLSRDRYGQKPLYWVRTAQGLFFASEIKPLLHVLLSVSANRTAMVEYLALGNYGHLGSQTFFHEVQSFPPAHYCYVNNDLNEPRFQRYWNLPFINTKERKAYGPEEKAQLRELVKEAVLSQTLSDVPIGMTLSGGIDSGVIAGILAQHAPSPVHVFSASNKGNRYDEMPYARLVTNHWSHAGRLIAHEVEMDSLSISRDLETALHIQEEPFGDPSILSHRHIMEQVHQNGIKVILGGQGADEIFFGYDSINRPLVASFLRNGMFGQFTAGIRQFNLSGSDVAQTVYAALLPQMFVNSRRKSRRRRRSFIQQHIVEQVDDKAIFLADPTSFNHLWRESIEGVHLPHLVHYDDRNGMSLGIEGRMPFLDHRIIDFLGRIKPEEFIRNGVRKFLLKDSCGDYLPSAILQRRDKVGFFAPIHEMIHAEIKHVKEQFHEHVFPLGLVDQKTLQNDLAKYETRLAEDIVSARRIWRVLSYALWMKMFRVSY